MLLDMCIQVRVIQGWYSCHEVIIYFSMDRNNVESVFTSVLVSNTWYLYNVRNKKLCSILSTDVCYI
jgi:hypothetical protein